MPSPTLWLTPAPDGKYYHAIHAGQSLYRIAELYGITFDQLAQCKPAFANGGLIPGDKLLLQVTPPPTATLTPEPSTETPNPPTEASLACR